MPEWWTYGLSDFLLFSPRTYYRLLERHNTGVWPGQVLAVALGLFLIWLLRRPGPGEGRAAAGLLGLIWAWVAVAFLWRRYATINWAAGYAAGAFLLEAFLLAWLGAVRGRLRFRAGRDAAGLVGVGLLALAVALYPAIAPLAGRSVRQAEVFGIAPDPTAIATLGLLLLADGRPRLALLPVPLLACLLSGATLFAMGSPDAWLPLAAAVLAGGASLQTRPAG